MAIVISPTTVQALNLHNIYVFIFLTLQLDAKQNGDTS